MRSPASDSACSPSAAPPLLLPRKVAGPAEVLEEGRVWRVGGLLTPAECSSLVGLAEAQGFKRSPASGGGHGRTGLEEPRNNSFAVVEDQALAQALFARVRPLLPDRLGSLSPSEFEGPKGEWAPVGIVERLRFYRYERGERYPEHMDGSYRRSRVGPRAGAPLGSGGGGSGKRRPAEDPAEGMVTHQQQSFVTLLCYLNDGFEGGETRFYRDHQHCRFLRDVEGDSKVATVEATPRQGDALLNVHHILHQGLEVRRGTKYVLRTDVVFERELPLHAKIERHLQGRAPKEGCSPWERIFEPSCKQYHD